MKLLVAALVVGVLEIYLVGELHGFMETMDLLLLYIGLTCIGAMIAWLNYSRFKLEMAKAEFPNKFSKRVRDGVVSENDLAKLDHAGYVFVYVVGCVFIAIPGIVTDLLGVLFVLPPVTSFFGRRLFENVRKEIQSGIHHADRHR